MSDQTITDTPAPVETPAEPVEPQAPVTVEHGQPDAPAPEAQPEQPAADGEPDMFDRAHVEKLRRTEAKYRTERNAERERAAALEAELAKYRDGLKALTGEGEAEKSPEDIIATLTQEREAAVQQLNTIRTESALAKAANDAGADAELLTLVLKGEGALTNLDPSTDDFHAQVAELVTAKVAANPKLKATPAVPQSSGSTPEDTATPRTGQLTRDDMTRMTPREINEAVQQGRFRDVLGG